MSNANGKPIPIPLSGLVVRSTSRAILFRVGEQQAWLPRSQILGVVGSLADGNLCEVACPFWLLEQNGLVKK